MNAFSYYTFKMKITIMSILYFFLTSFSHLLDINFKAKFSKESTLTVKDRRKDGAQTPSEEN